MSDRDLFEWFSALLVAHYDEIHEEGYDDYGEVAGDVGGAA